MNSRKLSFRAIVGRLFKRRQDARASVSRLPARPTSARDRVRSGIEPLEGRVAPAVLINAHTLTYNDIDGDLVKITFSSDIFDQTNTSALNSALQNVFQFSAGKAHTGAADATDDVPQQLQLIDLTKVPTKLVNGKIESVVSGLSMTISAETNPSSGMALGDGLANIGSIRAAGTGLGAVIIDGDLGKITAGGGGVSKVGIGILEVDSIGKLGTSTQVSTSSPDLHSVISGRLGHLIVNHDMQGYLQVVDASNSGGTATLQHGAIGQINIGGSLIGNPTKAGASDNTGEINSSYSIGDVFIGSGASDGIFGGGGTNSGSIAATNSIGHVVINGSIEGGTSNDTGEIASSGTIASIRIIGELKGSSGLRSGSISSSAALGDVTIGSATTHHDLIGGAGDYSGSIMGGAAVGNIHVYGNITGSSGIHTGAITAIGNLTSLVVDGNLAGSTGTESGAVDGSKSIGPILIGGNVNGGDGVASGDVVASAQIVRISVLGNVSGGTGLDSGSIFGGHDPAASAHVLGNVTIGGALIGGDGISSGALVSGGTIAAVRVGATLQSGPAIQGGKGSLSGSVFGHSGIASVAALGGIAGGAGADSGTVQTGGLLGSVSIRGDLAGGTGTESGSIFAHENSSAAQPVAGNIGTVTITGNLVGSTDRTALIQADGILGRATIGGIQGGTGSFSGALVSGAGVVDPGATIFVSIANAITGGTGANSGLVQIGGQLGSFTAGSLSNATVRAENDIVSFRVNGDVNGSTITARGQAVKGATSDVAIGTIAITGNVNTSTILAGYDVLGNPTNGDAQIGTVGVRGNWTASVLAAGVVAGTDGLFGTADDQLISGTNSSHIVAQIASIVVVGNVDGTSASGDHFGFVSQRIGSFTAKGVSLPLSSAPGQSFEVGTDGDTTVREVVTA